MSTNKLEITSQDIIAMLGFESRKIAASVDHYAAGSPLPHPRDLQAVIDRMSELNAALMQEAEVAEIAARAEAGMKVELV